MKLPDSPEIRVVKMLTAAPLVSAGLDPRIDLFQNALADGIAGRRLAERRRLRTASRHDE